MKTEMQQIWFLVNAQRVGTHNDNCPAPPRSGSSTEPPCSSTCRPGSGPQCGAMLQLGHHIIPSSSHSSVRARTWRNDGQSRRGRARSWGDLALHCTVSCSSAGCMPSRLFGTVTKAVVTNTEFSLSLVLRYRAGLSYCCSMFTAGCWSAVLSVPVQRSA